MILLALATAAPAAELRVVHNGDTVESIAASLGDPALAGPIRALNALGAADQPTVGRLLVLPASSVPQVDQQGFLVSVVGDVTVARPPAAAEPAELFRSIPADSVVCTGSRSFATLRVASACDGQGAVNDDVTLLADTCVELRSAVASTLGRSTALRVRQGSIVVSQPVDPGQVTVEAGAGVVSGEGGFRVHQEADGALRAEALTADLAVFGAGVEQSLRAGQGSRVRPAEGPSAPVDLIGSGPLVAPAPGAPLARATFQWEARPDAFGYLVSIAGDAAFTRVLYQEPVVETICAPSLLLLPLRNPEGLFWRVEAVDRFGFVGLPTLARPIGLPSGVMP